MPIVQFDPATMSLWYDLEAVEGARGSPAVVEALSAALDGSLPEAVDALRKIDDPKIKSRALQLISAFWHEKRHFLDMAATNYGAFRFRQFLDVYQNLPAVIHLTMEKGKLCCPLEIYDDPVRCAMMDVGDIPEPLVTLARMLARRRKMVEKDRRQLSSRFGSIELGGEAQFESLAYLSQMRFVASFFGAEGVESFNSAVFNLEHFSQKYQSVMNAARMVGLIPTENVKKDLLVIDTALLEAVIFASLQADYLPSQGEGYFESSYPADRFAKLGMHLNEKHPKLKDRKPGEQPLAESWNIVDKACKEVFGYSVADQIEADLQHFEKQAELKLYGNVPDDIEVIAKDYFGLRRLLLQRLQAAPEEIFSTERFVFETANQIQPNFVLCASRGRMGDPPEGYDRLMGYQEPDRDADKEPFLKWWWACAQKTEIPEGTAQDFIRLEHPESWYSCVDFYAPTAKLIMNGRRIRTMLDPEIMFAEQRLKDQFGITTEIFPSFEFPEELIDPEMFYFYRGTDELACDFSSRKINFPEGKVLSPWTMRRWPALAKRAIEQLGGHELAYYTFVRDWSPWIVTDEIFEDLKPLMS